MDVAIIGLGHVGKIMQKMFDAPVVYDPALGEKSATRDDVNACDIALVCVPTPCIDRGILDMSIVEYTVEWCETPLIVIRSTLNPGASDHLAEKYGKRIVVWPEYLGETPEHSMLNPAKRFLILGGAPIDRKKVLDLYFSRHNAYTSVKLVSRLEAEIIKLSENRAIAWKVAQVEELIDACIAAGVDYYAVRDAVYGDDPRFDLGWTADHPTNRGFNSKCIPKDVYAWSAWAKNNGYNPEITDSLLNKNRDWAGEDV